MSLLAALRDAIVQGRVKGGTCRSCIHFCTDPARIEVELPGLAALSSAHASVRAQDGLCLSNQRLINGRRRCASFATVR